MKQKHGNSIYKKLSNAIGLARDVSDYNFNLFNSSLSECIELVKQAGNITEVLKSEIMLMQNLDINRYNNSEKKIDNRVNLCYAALKEYQLFSTDKEQYLKNIYEKDRFNPKGVDINKDTIFEQSIKKLIISLGTEKNTSTVSAQFFELYEARQDKLRQVCQEFSKERKAFLLKHIKKEQKITEKSKNNQLER